MSAAPERAQAIYARHLLARDVDGRITRQRPLALLHANPDRTAWVRLRHFEAAVKHIGARHADVLFGGSDEALSLNVFGDHLDACCDAAEAVRR